MKRVAAIVFFLTSSALSCNFPFSDETDSPTQGRTETPTTSFTDVPSLTPYDVRLPILTITPTVIEITSVIEPPIGDLIYANTLSDGWPSYSNDRGGGQPTSNGYEMTLTSEEQWGNWIYSSVIEIDSFFAEVDITYVECSGESCAAGLLFHYISPENLKYFIINQNGVFTVVEKSGGSQGSLVISGEVPEDILRPATSNKLGLLVRDGLFSFFINGVQIGKVEAPSVATGDIGLYIQAKDGRSTVVFSNLAVYEPD